MLSRARNARRRLRSPIVSSTVRARLLIPLRSRAHTAEGVEAIRIEDLPQESYVVLQSAWIKENFKGLGPLAYALYSLMLAHQNKHGECWPKRKTLAEYMGLKERKITYLFRQLEGAGLIERTNPEANGSVATWRPIRY